MNKVLIFLGGYLPAKKYGGPVTSIYNLVENLGNDFSFYILSNDHDLGDKKRLPNIKEGWNRVGQANVQYVNEKLFTKKFFLAIIKEVQPDVIYLSSIFFYQMNFPAIAAAKQMNILVILAPRGELNYSALKIGQVKKSLYLKYLKLTNKLKNINFHTTSQEEYDNTKKIFKPKQEQIFLIPNMPCNVIENTERLHEKKFGVAKFVYLGRIHPIKNLLFTLERLVNISGEMNFDIYGAKENLEYWEKCEAVIEKLPKNVKVTYKGIIQPGESKKILTEYDCLLMPTLGENYGHSIAESVANGCHVILSKGTTMWDDIDGQGGIVVGLDDPEGWERAITRIIEMDADEMRAYDKELHDYAVKKLEIAQIKLKYTEMFNLIINNKIN